MIGSSDIYNDRTDSNPSNKQHEHRKISSHHLSTYSMIIASLIATNGLANELNSNVTFVDNSTNINNNNDQVNDINSNNNYWNINLPSESNLLYRPYCISSSIGQVYFPNHLSKSNYHDNNFVSNNKWNCNLVHNKLPKYCNYTHTHT